MEQEGRDNGMRKITRDKLRGKPLDEDCKRAYTTTHECGSDDNRILCYGIIDLMDDEPLDMCKICGAFL